MSGGRACAAVDAARPTNARRVVVRAAAVETIRRHAREAYPFECCGALVGREAVIEEAWPLANVTAEGPRRRFLVSAEDYRRAEARARERGWDLVGFYHSHPDHPAQPSQYDLDHAWPVFAYLIVSVPNGEPADLTSWRLAPDRQAFVADELLIER
jgi:proteasome lid subunit RPN8/RPN11